MAETPLLDLNALADKVAELALPKLLQRYDDQEVISILQSIIKEPLETDGSLVYISGEDAFKIQRLIRDIKGE